MKQAGQPVNKWKLQTARFDIQGKYAKEELRRSGIYAIVNLLNGHTYIGQSVDMLSRKKGHFNLLRNGKHTNPYLQNAFNFYGEVNFRFTVLECVPYHLLDDREQYWIERENPAYNIQRNVFEHTDRADKDNPPDGYYQREGESFVRPEWEKWVYGGQKNSLIRR